MMIIFFHKHSFRLFKEEGTIQRSRDLALFYFSIQKSSFKYGSNYICYILQGFVI